MRIDFIGPVGGLGDSLRPLERFFLETLRVETIVYLEDDGALDKFRQERHTTVLGTSPEADAWERTRSCIRADARSIDAHVERERQLGELMRLQASKARGTGELA